MPPFEVMDRYDDVVIWPYSGKDHYGEPTFGTRYQIRVRWSGKKMTEMLDAQGNPIKVDVTVVTAEDVPLYSLAWKGRIVDIPAGQTYPTAPDDGSPDEGLMQVVGFNSTPDILRRNTRRTAGLVRYSEEP